MNFWKAAPIEIFYLITEAKVVKAQWQAFQSFIFR